MFWGFPGGWDDKESACNLGDLGVILGLGRSREGGHGNPLQYSCLENPLGQRNLAGYSPWGCKECDMTKQLSTQHRKKMSNRRTEICKTKKQILDMINRDKYCFFDQTYKTDKNLWDPRNKKRENSVDYTRGWQDWATFTFIFDCLLKLIFQTWLFYPYYEN